jgi:hypothetical protein
MDEETLVPITNPADIPPPAGGVWAGEPGVAASALREAATRLQAARANVEDAVHNLAGTRAATAADLLERLIDVLHFAQRLAFVCEADSRYDAATSGAEDPSAEDPSNERFGGGPE